MRKLINAILVASLAILFSGCDNDLVASRAERNSRLACIDGVTYIISEYGYRGLMSVKLNKESKIVECEQSN